MRARQFYGVEVVEISEPSKPAALNAADVVARSWPRLYLDADIEIAPDAVIEVLAALSDGVLAARPSFRYDLEGTSPLVGGYYRARGRMPATRSALWGAGVYGLSEQGHERLGDFPSLTADDLWVDGLFTASDKRVIPTEPVLVRVPRTSKALISTLRRSHRGNVESGLRRSGRDTLTELAQSVRGVTSAIDAAIYAAFALASRVKPRNPAVWERDETTRSDSEVQVGA
jgi:hypothetical protein